jgi:hypothetical protein
MAATGVSNSWTANNVTNSYAVVADHSSATEVGWVDMRDFEQFAAISVAIALTGVGVNAFTIIGNSESDGSGTDSAAIASHAIGSAPDAAGDHLVLECNAQNIRELETTATGQLRYVTAKITAANAADDTCVVYVRSKPRFGYNSVGGDVVA